MDLESYRRRHKLTYADLGARLGVCTMTAWRWCNHRRSPRGRAPRGEYLRRILQEFGEEVSVHALLGLDDDDVETARSA